MNKAFENEDKLLLVKLSEINMQLDETTNCVEKLMQKSSSQIKEKIVEVRSRLDKLKKQKQESKSKLWAVKTSQKRSIEEKVINLDVETILKDEARALDKAIAKVTRTAKFCDSALNKAKVNLLSTELACLKAIEARKELNEVIHN